MCFCFVSLIPSSQDTLELNPDVAVVVAANFEFWPIIVAAVVAMIFIVIAVIALWAVSQSCSCLSRHAACTESELHLGSVY